MRNTDFGEVILSEQDILNGLYSGKITDISKVNIEDPKIVEQFNIARQQNADPFNSLKVYIPPNLNQEQFDKLNQSSWFMPEEYKNLDIESWILEKCSSEIEKTRVEQELDLFRQHGMIDVLKYLKYLVDTMRQNNILWGVGRGSSVASFCLYLLGVHKINSIKYDLDIQEFLK